MVIPNFMKQPWFWAIVVGLLVIGGAIYGGVKIGGYIHKKKFDSRQAELLKKSQESEARAEAWKNKAENAEYYAGKLKEQIGKDRQQAAANAEKLTEVYNQTTEDINKAYEDDKNRINDPNLTSCERCLDQCKRSNQLTAYGPEFSFAKCDPNSCADHCDTGLSSDGGP